MSVHPGALVCVCFGAGLFGLLKGFLFLLVLLLGRAVRANGVYLPVESFGGGAIECLCAVVVAGSGRAPSGPVVGLNTGGGPVVFGSI